MQGLRDRVAVVTGGGIGIGKGIARRLAAEGMRLTISASSNLAGTIVACGDSQAEVVERAQNYVVRIDHGGG